MGDTSDYYGSDELTIGNRTRKYARLSIGEDSKLSIGIDGTDRAWLDSGGTLTAARMVAGSAWFEGTGPVPVGASASPIYAWKDNKTGEHAGQPALCVVCGTRSDDPEAIFADLVLMVSSVTRGRSRLVSVIGRSEVAGVAVRTYSLDDAGRLNLAMSAYEYRVQVTVLGGQAPAL